MLPEVEAPERSGLVCSTGAGCGCFGLVPEVEGVGDERGVLAAVDVLGSELGGDPGGIGGAGGVPGGVALVGVGGAIVVDGPRG